MSFSVHLPYALSIILSTIFQSPGENNANFYRKIEDIKQEFKELKVDMKTDLEIIQDLLKKYRDPNLVTQNRVNILTDFEYYLHQVFGRYILISISRY